ncbi:polysaccharide biosynthesis/export family protein [Sphingomonas immobilis]|uniref:Polysaccharide biosynthesis/export family protein n=1 Tax=Sphingomonas immobilis TaxID=3063997 RepID=A0ABT9A2B7_9SPHN|nr:polysaccharide biosynthesis/export family protein [Sphingomonas sp. CA1-15]MDO7843693.1 polysaccharide biosynthesis/export family protein [Sphingomonas sp. CA1-15]
MIFNGTSGTGLRRRVRVRGWQAGVVSAIVLSGCSSMGASGPSTGAIVKTPQHDARVRAVTLSAAVVRSVVAAESRDTFASKLGNFEQRHGLIGAGDVLDISIWESPPAVLFSNAAISSVQAGASSVAQGATFPSQMVDADGAISIPFAGRVRAVGRAPAEVARSIQSRLEGKAHSPQVLVRIGQNQGGGVTVVGDVVNSRNVPLTTRNERLLDVLADAGGVRQPVDKILIQVTRGDTVVTRPLGAIIRDPRENVPLMSHDVVTALFQPYSFQALGALGSNAEVPFEGTGISLAQAIARVGGLQDNRANIKGVFIFRFEDPAALPPELRLGAPLTPEGKVPVIYRVDMSDPSTFFAMQTFPMRDKDIVYVSNAPIADFQKFTNLVSQMAFSVVGLVTTIS